MIPVAIALFEYINSGWLVIEKCIDKSFSKIFMWKKTHYEIFMSAKFKGFQTDIPNTKKWTEDIYKDKDSIFMISTFNGKNIPNGTY